MSKAIVAIYDDIIVARQIVEDLVDADFERSAISLVTNDPQNQYVHHLDENYAARDDAVAPTERAGFGAVVGVLTGALVGLAWLSIPGVVGTLVKSGVPEDEVPSFAEEIQRGGTLVSVETSDTLCAEDIMNRYDSINIHEQVDVWRQAGWKGFEAEENENADKSSPGLLTSATTKITTTRVTHMTHNGSPVSAKSIHTMLDEESEKQVTLTEPALLRFEEERNKEHENIIPDFQNLESAINYSKG